MYLLLAAIAGFPFHLPPLGGQLPADQVLRGLRVFVKNAAKADGSYRPGIDPDYEGMSDSAFSDLAPTAYAVVLGRTFGWPMKADKTKEFLHGRQLDDGAFVNRAGSVDPKSAAGRAYNTTMAMMALSALGEKPRHDPLPVFDAVLKDDYKSLPAYMTSFFPLAYLLAGKPIPDDADAKLRALMIPADDGYVKGHVAATFHSAHFHRLTGRDTPKAEAMVTRVLKDQKADGSWVVNRPSRDRHATFDAVFILKHLGGDRDDCKMAIARAARWAMSCRNLDGGFGHVPGSPSDLDACYFQAGTLVLAGILKPDAKLPAEAKLWGWGHLMTTEK